VGSGRIETLVVIGVPIHCNSAGKDLAHQVRLWCVSEQACNELWLSKFGLNGLSYVMEVILLRACYMLEKLKSRAVEKEIEVRAVKRKMAPR
jgi:hypothetical protein